MKESKYTDSYLLSQFRDFQILLSQLREMARTGTWVYSPDLSGGKSLGTATEPNAEKSKEAKESTDSNSEETAVDEKAASETRVSSSLIFQKLLSFFEEQQVNAGRRGGDFGVTLYREALFVMVAMADEVFLTLDWVGQKNWKRFLLETKFFSSNSAGETFFQRLDKLLQERDPIYWEIGVIYLFALSLGFRGKYYTKNDNGQLEDYRKQLFNFIFNRKSDLELEDKRFFPEAYDHTLEQEAEAMIPGLKKWVGLLIGLIILLLVTSHLIWTQMTGDLDQVVLQILGQ